MALGWHSGRPHVLLACVLEQFEGRRRGGRRRGRVPLGAAATSTSHAFLVIYGHEVHTHVAAVEHAAVRSRTLHLGLQRPQGERAAPRSGPWLRPSEAHRCVGHNRATYPIHESTHPPYASLKTQNSAGDGGGRGRRAQSKPTLIFFFLSSTRASRASLCLTRSADCSPAHFTLSSMV